MMQELTTVPSKSCDRKVNELVKRVRAMKVHLLLLQHLKEMPAMFYKQKKQAKILDAMPDHFRVVRGACC
jgi:EH domain-containing protein 1